MPSGLPTRRFALALVLLALLIGAVGTWAREPVEAVAAWFVGRFGLYGVAALVFLIDGFFVHDEPALLVGWTGGLGFLPVWGAASCASILAGLTGWTLGRLVGPLPPVAALLDRTQVRHLFERHGGRAVAIAAISPVPYSLATWAAGAARVPAHELLFGTLFRIPKLGLLLALIAAGWSATG
jgi:membrane protein YqaA with SNARE-associated domain